MREHGANERRKQRGDIFHGAVLSLYDSDALDGKSMDDFFHIHRWRRPHVHRTSAGFFEQVCTDMCVCVCDSYHINLVASTCAHSYPSTPVDVIIVVNCEHQ